MQVAAFFCRRILPADKEGERLYQAGAIGVFRRAYMPFEIDLAVLLTSQVTGPDKQYLSFDLMGEDGPARNNVIPPKALSNGAIESQQIVPMKLRLTSDLAIGRYELKLLLDGQEAFALPFEIDT